MADLAALTANRQYVLLDGDETIPTTAIEIIDANDFDENEIAEIVALPIGGEIVYGGGAASEFVLRRIA